MTDLWLFLIPVAVVGLALIGRVVGRLEHRYLQGPEDLEAQIKALERLGGVDE